MNAIRYLLASLALALIAVWASENLFWIAPPADLTPFGLLYVWLAYSFCTASALSAVFVTAIRGLPAAFLAAAVMGWLVEGVIVGEMYLAFPYQLVWTPLAWHALITGVAVFGLGRMAVHWPLARQIGVWVLLGLFTGFWAQYWPLERSDLPGAGVLLAYLAGLGVLVPVAQIILDRLTPLERPPPWVLLIAPATLAALWIAQSFATPSWLRLSLPVLLALTLWVMKRLGAGGSSVGFGRPAPHPVRHVLFLLAPLLGAPLGVAGWTWSGGFEANVGVAFAGGAVSLIGWGWLFWRAARRKSAKA